MALVFNKLLPLKWVSSNLKCGKVSGRENRCVVSSEEKKKGDAEIFNRVNFHHFSPSRRTNFQPESIIKAWRQHQRSFEWQLFVFSNDLHPLHIKDTNTPQERTKLLVEAEARILKTHFSRLRPFFIVVEQIILRRKSEDEAKHISNLARVLELHHLGCIIVYL